MNEKTIKFIKGTVRYQGMWRPISLETSEGVEVIISDIIYDFLEKNNRKPAKVVTDRESFSLKTTESDRVLDIVREFKDDKLNHFSISLETPDGYTGWTNTLVQLEYLFMSLVGRKAILELEEDTITVKLDVFDDDDTKSVYYTHNNMSNLPRNWTVENTCKPGTHDACIFLTSGQHGFACAKFDGPTARILLERHVNGELNASRIGTCKCAGRWEELLNHIQEQKNNSNENA